MIKYIKPPSVLTCLLLLFSLSNVGAQEVIAKLDGVTVSAIADSSTLESLLTEIFEVSELPEVELGDLQFRVVANNIYLTSSGKTEEGNDVTIARLLNQRDGSLYQGSTVHACTGTPCQECYFTGNVFTGEIEGCGCLDTSPAGQVSHTIVEFE